MDPAILTAAANLPHLLNAREQQQALLHLLCLKSLYVWAMMLCCVDTRVGDTPECATLHLPLLPIANQTKVYLYDKDLANTVCFLPVLKARLSFYRSYFGLDQPSFECCFD